MTVVACVGAVAPVSAQPTPQAVDASPTSQPPPPAGVITTAPSQTYAQAPPAYSVYDLEEAKERSRRVRVALIATSAAFAVGVIIAGIGASQCEWITQPGSDVYRCNNAGDVMVPLGGTIAGLAAIGMITSGAMLGVRNRTKREIERDIRRRYYGSRFHWDIDSGRFVF